MSKIEKTKVDFWGTGINFEKEVSVDNIKFYRLEIFFLNSHWWLPWLEIDYPLETSISIKIFNSIYSYSKRIGFRKSKVYVNPDFYEFKK